MNIVSYLSYVKLYQSLDKYIPKQHNNDIIRFTSENINTSFLLPENIRYLGCKADVKGKTSSLPTAGTLDICQHPKWKKEITPAGIEGSSVSGPEGLIWAQPYHHA